MKNKRLRVGVIGLGVGERHASSYASHPKCEVAALCDQNETKLGEFRGRYESAVLTTNPNNVLQDETIDAVSVASHDADHFEQIMKALRAGKHVFAEKPVCLFREEAIQIHQLLGERPELILSAHFPLRSTPRFHELITNVRQGTYGELYLLQADYNYGRVEKILEGWRADAEYYSVILDGAIHLIDLLCQILGERVVRVTAAGNKIVTAGTKFRFDDCVACLLQFDSGVLATITANFGNVTPHVHLVRLYGTKASFEHDLRGAWRYTSRDPLDEPENINTPYRQERQKDTSEVVHSFVEAILKKGVPEVTPSQIFDSLAVCFAIEESHQTGQLVSVKYIE